MTVQSEPSLRPVPGVGDGDRCHAASIPCILTRVTVVPDWPDRGVRQRGHALIGAEAVLRWLAGFPGAGWQERWRASGADRGIDWFARVDAGSGKRTASYQRVLVQAGASALILARIILPSFVFLRTYNPKELYRRARMTMRPDLFARAEDNGAALNVPPFQRGIALAALAAVVLHTGRDLDQLTSDDLLAFRESHRSRSENKPPKGISVAWDLVRGIAKVPDTTLAVVRAKGQLTAEQILDHYPIKCYPIRDVLIRYVSERRSSLDYAPFDNLARILARFWVDIETHNPGIDTLALSHRTASEWKQRVRTVVNPDGTTRPRLDQLGIFVIIRAFYLDISQWALEDPSWVRWAVPCPVSRVDTDGYAKNKQRVTARMHQRVRERLPRLAELCDAADQRRADLAALLANALATTPDSQFDHAGFRYLRCGSRPRSEPPTAVVRRSRDPAVVVKNVTTGQRIDLTRAEDEAFWSWAIIETLRHTGVRVEELTEITQLALVSYRTPDTGEHIPLLQVVPSKSNEERVLLVSPELASVLATVISRLREDSAGVVPRVVRVDRYEREESMPLPYLFQRRRCHRYTVITPPRCQRPAAVSARARRHPWPGRGSTPHHRTRLPPHVRHRSRNRWPARAHRGETTRPRQHHHHTGLPRGVPGRADPHLPPPPGHPASAPSDRGISGTNRGGVDRVPGALRRPQAGTRHLRTPLRNPMQPRARMHTVPDAPRRPTSPTSPCRHHRQPQRTHRRSPHQRLARRNPRTPNQPRRRRPQTCHLGPRRQAESHRNAVGHSGHT